jgi:hypothetical protein
MKKRNKIINLLIIVAGFVALYYVKKNSLFIYISGTLLIAGLLFEKFLDLILLAWTKIGHVLGYINTRIILFILFYFIITPYAFIMRIFKGGNMQLKPSGKTMMISSEKKYTSSDLENMW